MLFRAPFTLRSPGAREGFGLAAAAGILAGSVGGLVYHLFGQHVIDRPYWGPAAAGIPSMLAGLGVFGFVATLAGEPFLEDAIGLPFWLIYGSAMGVALGYGIRAVRREATRAT